jgi:hypothetical protein
MCKKYIQTSENDIIKKFQTTHKRLCTAEPTIDSFIDHAVRVFKRTSSIDKWPQIVKVEIQL